MSLEIVIEVLDDEDYDGNSIQIKRVIVNLDGVRVPIYYSFEVDKSDAEIEAEVESDLSARGYSWGE